MTRKYIHVRSTAREKRIGLKTARQYNDKNLSSRAKNILKKIDKKNDAEKDTQSRYKKKGKYTASRRKFHKKIIKGYLKQDTPTKNPDLYMMGGVPGSGKSSAVRGYIREKAIIINNDDIKAKLAKRNRSPIKKYPLIHATLLHEEASDVEVEIINKARQQKKDVVLDRTMKSWVKNNELVNKFRKSGYKVHVYGSNLKPHISVKRVAKRFIEDGRFVPLGMIVSHGNQTNMNVVRMAQKPYIKSAVIVDTNGPKGKGKIIYRKKNYEAVRPRRIG